MRWKGICSRGTADCPCPSCCSSRQPAKADVIPRRFTFTQRARTRTPLPAARSNDWFARATWCWRPILSARARRAWPAPSTAGKWRCCSAGASPACGLGMLSASFGFYRRAPTSMASGSRAWRRARWPLSYSTQPPLKRRLDGWPCWLRPFPIARYWMTSWRTAALWTAR